MKKLLGLSVLVLALGLASPALAEHNGALDSADESPSASIDGRTTEITGRVLDIDYQQGALMLDTARGLLALQGPPEALAGVSIGDVVRVRVALSEEAPAPSVSDEREQTEMNRR
ncbi:MAG TPA: hypothetical protein VID04_16515 [Methylomirabilota bacterium]|jgi:hypothetical protein